MSFNEQRPKNLDKKRPFYTFITLDDIVYITFIYANVFNISVLFRTNRKNAFDNVDGVAVSSDRLSDSTCIEEDLPSQVELRGIRSPSSNSSVKRSSRFLDLSEKRESRMLELNEQRGNRLLESPADSSFGSMKRLPGSEENLTTGSESIDVTLTHHLMFTEYLLSHLGAFGPQTKGGDSIEQAPAASCNHRKQLIVLAVSWRPCQLRRICCIPGRTPPSSELKLNLPLLEFWEQCREKEAPLCECRLRFFFS
nr:uncharacterized protein LOC129278055 [Lytechinus pictus]